MVESSPGTNSFVPTIAAVKDGPVPRVRVAAATGAAIRRLQTSRVRISMVPRYAEIRNAMGTSLAGAFPVNCVACTDHDDCDDYQQDRVFQDTALFLYLQREFDR